MRRLGSRRRCRRVRARPASSQDGGAEDKSEEAPHAVSVASDRARPPNAGYAGTKAPCSLDPLSIGLVDVVPEITIRLQLWRIGANVLVAINGKPSEGGIQQVCSDVFHTPRTCGRPAPVFIVEAAQQFL